MLLTGELSKDTSFRYMKMASAFDPSDYRLLHTHFPDLERIPPEALKTSNGGNRFDIDLETVHRFVEHPGLQKIIDQHTSLHFFHSLCELFDVDKEPFRTISSRYDSVDTDVKVDFQFSFNEKNRCKRKSYLRAPHLDATDKLFVILVYFPVTETRYEDLGNLRLYATKDPTATFRNNQIFALHEIDHVPYAPNHGIVFLNGPTAIHAPECLLNHPEEHRRFVNIIFMKSQSHRSE